VQGAALPAHSLSRTHYFAAGAGGSVTSSPAPALKHVLERSVPSAARAGCLADDERWRAYHGGDELDEPAELAFYCPECAEREFDLLGRPSGASARECPRRTKR
jgi:hypothetical protein